MQALPTLIIYREIIALQLQIITRRYG
ncbi:hypothetical protein RDABS01_033428 [Bienertia sinuspersici]